MFLFHHAFSVHQSANFRGALVLNKLKPLDFEYHSANHVLIYMQWNVVKSIKEMVVTEFDQHTLHYQT